MPVLNWIGKEKIVNHDKEVPFRLLRKNKKFSLGNSENLILEGDNLEALKALMPFYYGKIKCIYIDPPYNTGNEKWVYNDRVNSPKIKEWFKKIVGPEGEDLTRHDKWLCMMYPRLKLLKELLSEEGVIFVSIDDNEFVNLKIIMDDIFDNNFVQNFMWLHGKGKKDRWSRTLQQYILCYAKNKNQLPSWSILSYANYKFENPDSDKRGDWFSGSVSFSEVRSNKRHQNYFEIESPSGVIWKRQWQKSRREMDELLKNKKIFFGLPPKYNAVPRIKIFPDDIDEQIPPNIIDEVESTRDAQKKLDEIFEKKVFDYPKPVSLMRHLIKISSGKNDIILDSFAGSGTTAHAVLDLNKEDGGNRKFILVELEKNIAKNITAERIKRVAQGYSYKTGKGKTVKVPGLGGGFEYVELGGPLFDKDGMISKTVSFEDMARYVYFTETRTNLEKKNIQGNYLGEFSGAHYFLLFNGINENVLDRKFLKNLKAKDGRKIIYADKCLLDEEVLEKHQIVFKQIPYQIRVY